MRRAWVAGMVLAVTVPLALAGCGREPARFVDRAPTPTPALPVEPFSLVVTPKEKAKNLPISTEIGTRVVSGEITSVELVEKGGKKVAGAAREDGSAWVPDRPLRHGRTYTATVKATGVGGETATATTTFTTMGAPGLRTGTGLYLFDDREYGVAMPVVVEFSPGVPEKARAGVQKRMFVRTDPPQPGTWHWMGSGRQAFYRAPDYWKPGTTLSVRLGLDGHPTGGGRFGDMDRSATVTIGRAFEMRVANSTKQMTVYEDGKLVRTMPVSLGKKSTPSSSGTMVIMDKQESTVFDTFEELGPDEGYRIDIDFAQRLTWGGEFIHAAPWSVGDQGRRNVSHGCVNLSTPNARWLFEKTRIGDPVTVTGTEVKLVNGNGWTPWNLSWEQFKKGSALPVPDELKPAPKPDPSPSPSLSPSAGVSPSAGASA